MKLQSAVDSSWTVNQVIAMYPEAIAVFNAFGIDMCCGGDESLESAVRISGADRDKIMSLLVDVSTKAEVTT